MSDSCDNTEAERRSPDALEHIAAVVCLSCGSNAVDINTWINGQGVIRCYRCGNETHLAGFTLGREYVERAKLERIRQDAARLGDMVPPALASDDDAWEAAVCRLALVPRSQLRPAEWDASIHYTTWMDDQRSTGRGVR